jgi:tRNA(fMet)-specific endonuclease VapC
MRFTENATPTCENEGIRHRHTDAGFARQSSVRRARREDSHCRATLPIVVAEEVLRGRLNAIRQAEAGKGKLTIEQAYQYFEQTLSDLRQFTLLSFNIQAETQYQTWRTQKLRGSTHDLRIAAVCMVHSVTLVTRNRRDFEHIPGLSVEFWE